MDSGANCILTDKNKKPSIIIADIDILKNKIYANPEQKEMFLKILNGRLQRDPNDLYPADAIDGILDAINDQDTLRMNKIIMNGKNIF